MNFKNIFNGLSDIVQTFSSSKNSVSVMGSNGSIITINGKTVTNSENEEKIVIGKETFYLKDFTSITIKIETEKFDGDVSTMSGNVDISGNVEGDLKTMSGNIKCGDIVADKVSTMSGDITSKGLSKVGKVSSMSGDINL